MVQLDCFDIIGDLSLGESFGCLQESNYHPWVSFLFNSFKAATFLGATRSFPTLTKILVRLVPKDLIQARIQHSEYTAEKVVKRRSMGAERGDFMSNVLRNNEKEVYHPEYPRITVFS